MPNSSKSEAIGKRIQQARIERDLAPAALAEKIGVSRPSILNWEKGATKVSAEDLFKLARELGKPAEWFVHGDEGGKAVERRHDL